ncbi:tetratricopeptide repeat protein [Streptomyces sp. NPDC058613]|uniref:tetratricopeptide repeat protein n=1 Tax=Streptomyces sp. NPDC058613 TaxID=3346556 RepID=UPI0036522EB2
MPAAGKSGGGGRPWRPVQTGNPHARQLAEFLRRRVDESGKTLARLAAEVPFSKSQISVYLGGKIPSQAFVTGIVDATVPAPLRERRRGEANRLLYDALHPPEPAPGTAARPAGTGGLDLVQVQARQIETLDNLNRSLEQREALRQAAENSAKLIMVLLRMIHTLQDRVTGLTDERDQLTRAGSMGALEAVQRKLTRAESQTEKAREELERAEEKQREAEELAARLQQRIEKLTDDLDRLRGDEPSPHDHLPGLTTAASPPMPGPVSEDPEGDDIDAALARASAINDTDAVTVDRITTELTETDSDTGLIILDNPPTSTDTQDKPLAKQAPDARVAEAERIGHAGDPAAARDLYAALVADHARILGTDHPRTLTTRYDHAHWTGQAGDAAGARDLYTALVADHARILGTDHHDTLTTRYDHAHRTGQAGDAAAARDLYTALIADRTRILGPDHHDTLTTRGDHAHRTGQAGDATGARDLYTALAADRTRILGTDHHDTLTTRYDHAHRTGQAGDAAGARDLYTALIADHARILGPDHPGTLTARYGHAFWTGQAGDRARARGLSAVLTADRTRILGTDTDAPKSLTSRARAYLSRRLEDTSE